MKTLWQLLQKVRSRQKSKYVDGKKSQSPETNTDFRGAPFTIPDDSVRDMTPLDYFQLFWDDDVMTMLVE